MKKVFIVVGVLICSQVCIIFFYRNYKNSQKEEVKAKLIYNLFESKSSVSLKTKKYTDSTTTFWLDRSYTSKSTIRELVDLEFVSLPRNFKGQILGFCNKKTIIYCIGNENEYINLKNWKYIRPILVKDSYHPRSMTGLFMQKINKGPFVLNYHDLRPSLPIFFKEGELSFESLPL